MGTPYIWQREGWPNFTWDTQVLERSAYAYALEAGRLAAEVQHLPKNEQMDALIDLMVSEAVTTSQIEGETYDREDVRSSIRNQLGLNAMPQAVRDSRANGIAALMISVRDHMAADLTAERLWEWQDMIIVGRYERVRLEVGRWRESPEPMQIVSGAVGREKVHYEAPSAAQVPKEMERFIAWFNGSRSMPGAVRAGVAHLWFECVHPFSDGNGRIGRALAEKALSQELKHPVVLSLSTAIERRRKEYYDALSQASQGGLDITEWLVWFTELVLEAQAQAKERIAFVLAKARFWDRYTGALNGRQTKALTRMLREGPGGFKGGMSAQKYMKIADCSKATATRDLAELSKMGALFKLKGGGRSTRYDIGGLV
jgi:Fic family protein